MIRSINQPPAGVVDVEFKLGAAAVEVLATAEVALRYNNITKMAIGYNECQ